MSIKKNQTNSLLKYRASVFALIALLLGVLWRWPLYSNADGLVWSDEAANLLTFKLMFETKQFFFYYLGMRYQGITESLLAIPFIPFFGWSALSQKLAGSVVWIFFCVMSVSLVFREAKNQISRLLIILLCIFPPAYLYYVSFMAYGGHLLNVAIGFWMLKNHWDHYESKKLDTPSYYIRTLLILTLGVYTYKHFLIFYPVFFLFFISFKNKVRSKPQLLIRLSIMGSVFLLVPYLVQKIGYFLQEKTTETINSFMSFNDLMIAPVAEAFEKLQLFLKVWGATFFWYEDSEQSRLIFSGTIFSIIALLFFYVSCKGQNKSAHKKILAITAIHFLVVILSVIFNRYAAYPMDIRYFLPMLCMAPFLGMIFFQKLEEFKQRRLVLTSSLLVISSFAYNTLQFNRTNGLIENFTISQKKSGLEESIEYFKNNRIDCIYADYPDAYRIVLLSKFQVRATALNFARIQQYEDCAEKRRPRLLFLADSFPELQSYLDSGRSKVGELKFKTKAELGSYFLLESVERN